MNTLHATFYITGIILCASSMLKKMRGPWTAVFLVGIAFLAVA